MILLGGVIILLVTVAVWRAYADYLKERRESCRIFIRMLADMRDKMYCYLISPREWAQKYDDVDKYGFAEKVKEGQELYSAYMECRGRTHIPDAADAILRDYFSRVGDSYVENEVAAADNVISELRKIDAQSSEEALKKTKVAGALLGAFSTGIVILIL